MSIRDAVPKLVPYHQFLSETSNAATVPTGVFASGKHMEDVTKVLFIKYKSRKFEYKGGRNEWPFLVAILRHTCAIIMSK